MVIKILFMTFFLVNLNAFAKCNYLDYTANDKEIVKKRNTIYQTSEREGYRLSFNGLKGNNKDYGIGTVDNTVKLFGQSLCESVKDPEVEVTIIKMDYKGYEITCNPKSKCGDVAQKMDSIEQNFIDENGKKLSGKLSTSVEKGDNYIDGYMRSRGKAIFGEGFDSSKIQDMNAYLKDEMDNALKDYFGSDIDLNSPKGKALSDAIDVYRTGDPKTLDPKMKKIIEVLDAMEVPYQGSNNFDKELTEALSSDEDGKSSQAKKKSKGRYDVVTARGGDDMTLIVKNSEGQVQKIVGADARGLGKLNFWTRIEEYVEQSAKGELKDVIQVSQDAIVKADVKMHKTMAIYQEILNYNLEHLDTNDMDEIIRASHDAYNSLVAGTVSPDNPPSVYRHLLESGDLDTIFDDDLMEMRTGAINACNLDNQCVKDRITDIHNTLKLMEKAGINGHFGDSCVGVEFWARKLGAKSIQSLD